MSKNLDHHTRHEKHPRLIEKAYLNDIIFVENHTIRNGAGYLRTASYPTFQVGFVRHPGWVICFAKKFSIIATSDPYPRSSENSAFSYLWI